MKPYEAIKGHTLRLVREADGAITNPGNRGIIVDKLGGCVLTWLRGNEFTPYATHLLHQTGDVINGRYFQTLDEARDDLIARYVGAPDKAPKPEELPPRAARAYTTLGAYATELLDLKPLQQYDAEEVIIDLLTDLKHYCDWAELNYEAMEETAATHFRVEADKL